MIGIIHMTPQHNSATIIDNMQQQFDIMRTASRQDQYVDWSIRSARLKKLEQMVMDNQSEIITAINADFFLAAHYELTNQHIGLGG